jgi:hypothetical protein
VHPRQTGILAGVELLLVAAAVFAVPAELVAYVAPGSAQGSLGRVVEVDYLSGRNDQG